jgi:hypothetical protein
VGIVRAIDGEGVLQQPDGRRNGLISPDFVGKSAALASQVSSQVRSCGLVLVMNTEIGILEE